LGSDKRLPADAAHPGALATPAVLGLSPYVPGKPIAELEREYGVHDIVKLASNENPWGPSPAAIAAIQAALPELWLYPDGGAHDLKQAIARHLGLHTTRVTVGNGSNELLLMLAETFLGPGRSGVYAQYGFAIYPLVIRATGARCIVAPAQPPGAPMPYGHDLDTLAAAITPDTRLVFIANPNNPTGTWLDGDALRAFIANAPTHTLVVLDEAYLEYARVDDVAEGLAWVDEFPNLVLLRTFSKAYGLAGARIGYAVSHPEVANAMDRIRPAFNVGSLAQAAGVAALTDLAHVEQVAQRTVAERRRMEGILRERGVRFVPSVANFLLIEVGEGAAAINENLLRAGLIVRPVGGYGLPRHLRVTVGMPAHNDRLLAELQRLMAKP
jgi:histidinol-phosphate aminotransferase